MRASGLERSPSDSTDTERSVRKIVPPNESKNPRRNGDVEKARPPLWPGVCQFVPAFVVTYCLSAVEKRGIQKLLKRWTIRSWHLAGCVKTVKSFFVQRRAGIATSGCPRHVTTTFGMAGKKSFIHARRGRPSMSADMNASSMRKRQHARPASVSTPRGPPLVKSARARLSGA